MSFFFTRYFGCECVFNLSNVVSVPMPTSKPSKLHLLCNACIIILPLHQQPISLCMCVHVCVWTPLYLYWYYYYHQLQFAAIESPHGSRFTARLCCPHNFINRKEIISTLSCVLSDLCSSYSNIDDPTTPNWWLLPSWQWIKWAYVIIYWYWVSL